MIQRWTIDNECVGSVGYQGQFGGEASASAAVTVSSISALKPLGAEDKKRLHFLSGAIQSCLRVLIFEHYLTNQISQILQLCRLKIFAENTGQWTIAVNERNSFGYVSSCIEVLMLVFSSSVVCWYIRVFRCRWLLLVCSFCISCWIFVAKLTLYLISQKLRFVPVNLAIDSQLTKATGIQIIV